MSLLSIVWAYLNPFGSPSIQGLIEDGTTQSGLLYCVYLPLGYDANNRYPVIYHLHGAGEFYGMMKREVLWTAQHAELNDFDVIIVAPSDPTKFSMWADGKQIHIASLFHNELIPKIESTYSVDENKYGWLCG
jgi:predicted peptidase